MQTLDGLVGLSCFSSNWLITQSESWKEVEIIFTHFQELTLALSFCQFCFCARYQHFPNLLHVNSACSLLHSLKITKYINIFSNLSQRWKLIIFYTFIAARYNLGERYWRENEWKWSCKKWITELQKTTTWCKSPAQSCSLHDRSKDDERYRMRDNFANYVSEEISFLRNIKWSVCNSVGNQGEHYRESKRIATMILLT